MAKHKNAFYRKKSSWINYCSAIVVLALLIAAINTQSQESLESEEDEYQYCPLLIAILLCKPEFSLPELVADQTASCEKVYKQAVIDGAEDFEFEKVYSNIRSLVEQTEILAERGNSRAQNFLAAFFESTQCPPFDLNKAIYWYQKAAEQGSPVAQDKMAKKYLSGKGVPQNPSKALKLFNRAAEKGYRESQWILAQRYRRGGYGIDIDLVQAYKWYRILKEGGSQPIREISQLEAELTPDQIKEAENLALEWIKEHRK